MKFSEELQAVAAEDNASVALAQLAKIARAANVPHMTVAALSVAEVGEIVAEQVRRFAQRQRDTDPETVLAYLKVEIMVTEDDIRAAERAAEREQEIAALARGRLGRLLHHQRELRDAMREAR